MESNRYHRQLLLPQWDQAGQEKLAASRFWLIGCGALGGVVAEQMVRAGVGWLCIADRDVVELTNLQRQVLFDEEDARQGLPKAAAAVRRLGRINSTVHVEGQVVDVHAGNIEEICQAGHFDLIIDGTDNVAVRYLINDVAVKHGVPWIYGGCVGTEGRVMAIRPPRGPCLRCLFPTPAAPGELPTCDTAGVLASAAGVVASLQSTLALKLLSGNAAAVAQEMLVLDVWQSRFRSIDVSGAKRPDCPCCAGRQFEFLDAIDASGTTSLCGRDAVQIRAPRPAVEVDLPAVERKLAGVGEVERTAYLVRCRLRDPDGIWLTIFPDGRVIVQGTSDETRARSLAARFVGG